MYKQPWENKWGNSSHWNREGASGARREVVTDTVWGWWERAWSDVTQQKHDGGERGREETLGWKQQDGGRRVGWECRGIFLYLVWRKKERSQKLSAAVITLNWAQPHSLRSEKKPLSSYPTTHPWACHNINLHATPGHRRDDMTCVNQLHLVAKCIFGAALHSSI